MYADARAHTLSANVCVCVLCTRKPTHTRPSATYEAQKSYGEHRTPHMHDVDMRIAYGSAHTTYETMFICFPFTFMHNLNSFYVRSPWTWEWVGGGVYISCSSCMAHTFNIHTTDVCVSIYVCASVLYVCSCMSCESVVYCFGAIYFHLWVRRRRRQLNIYYRRFSSFHISSFSLLVFCFQIFFPISFFSLSDYIFFSFRFVVRERTHKLSFSTEMFHLTSWLWL